MITYQDSFDKACQSFVVIDIARMTIQTPTLGTLNSSMRSNLTLLIL